MDLEALGHADLGDELAGRYLAAAGDETLGLLQPLHRAYRAFVRGKVESIGARAPETPEEQSRALAASAARFFRLAASYAARRAAPQLIALSGLPASGKSTVAATLACRIGAAYLSSDVVRKQLAGIDPRERVREEWRSGLYAPEMTERTYAELRARAARLLRDGRAVVLDAMHGRRAERDAVRALAAELGVAPLIRRAAHRRRDRARAHRRPRARPAPHLGRHMGGLRGAARRLRADRRGRGPPPRPRRHTPARRARPRGRGCARRRVRRSGWGLQESASAWP